MADYNLGHGTMTSTFDGSEVHKIVLDGTTIWEYYDLPDIANLRVRYNVNDGSYLGSGDLMPMDNDYMIEGTINGPTHSTSNGGYFDYDGSNDYIELIHNRWIDIEDDGLTLSMWFRTDTSHNGVVWNGDDQGNSKRMWQVKKKSNGQFGPVAFTGTGASTNQNKFTSGWNNNTWYHCVWTIGPYDSGKGQHDSNVYRNNTNVSSSAITINMGANSANMMFGKRSYGTANAFNGRIGHCAMWKGALNSTEVGQIWNLDKGDYGY